jgi:protein-histidine pros-kinase
VTFFFAMIAVNFLCGAVAGLACGLASVIWVWLFVMVPGDTSMSVYQTLQFSSGTLVVIALIAVMRAGSAQVRRLNETLHISEAKFRGLLESAPDAMIIVDEQRRIALVNFRAETLFGCPRNVLIGRSIDRLLSPPEQERYLAQFAALVTGAWAPPVLELDALQSDGTAFPVEVSLALLKTETGFLISHAIRDITARRQVEERLAEASKAKSDFLARMSHELRTPLNAIIGFSEIIRDAAMGPLSQRYREYGGDISSAGRHLQNIINDILDISKVEGGRLELREEIVSIAETVEGCRRIVTAMADTARVTLAIDIPDAIPYVRLDRLRFRQILLNLMSNAVKFTPEGGTVSVSATANTVGLLIAVADTGIGMTQDEIAIALQPFRQIEGALSRRFDGTGLGLPLAKALLDLHGGALEITSMPGRGTTVRISLPAERVVEAAA